MSAQTGHKETRQELREMLLQLQRETRQRIEDFRRDQRQEADSDPADSMDTARTTEEVETHASLISGAEEKLRYLDEALTRLEEGKYGNCVGCKQPIPIARLRALPFAAFCVDCQETRNRARVKWAEGTMIQPYDQQWTLPEEMEEPPSRDYHSTALEEDLVVRSPLAESGLTGPTGPAKPAPRKARKR